MRSIQNKFSCLFDPNARVELMSSSYGSMFRRAFLDCSMLLRSIPLLLLLLLWSIIHSYRGRNGNDGDVISHIISLFRECMNCVPVFCSVLFCFFTALRVVTVNYKKRKILVTAQVETRKIHLLTKIRVNSCVDKNKFISNQHIQT